MGVGRSHETRWPDGDFGRPGDPSADTCGRGRAADLGARPGCSGAVAAARGQEAARAEGGEAAATSGTARAQATADSGRAARTGAAARREDAEDRLERGPATPRAAADDPEGSRGREQKRRGRSVLRPGKGEPTRRQVRPEAGARPEPARRGRTGGAREPGHGDGHGEGRGRDEGPARGPHREREGRGPVLSGRLAEAGTPDGDPERGGAACRAPAAGQEDAGTEPPRARVARRDVSLRPVTDGPVWCREGGDAAPGSGDTRRRPAVAVTPVHPACVGPRACRRTQRPGQTGTIRAVRSVGFGVSPKVGTEYPRGQSVKGRRGRGAVKMGGGDGRAGASETETASRDGVTLSPRVPARVTRRTGGHSSGPSASVLSSGRGSAGRSLGCRPRAPAMVIKSE